MGRKPSPRPMGAPYIPIDKKDFEAKCEEFCTKEEIASSYGVSEDKLAHWIRETYGDGATFSVVFKKLNAKGRCSLRSLQWKSAKEGSVVAQIFLGKQVLGQSDKVEQYVNVLPTATQITFMDEKEKLVLGAKLIENEDKA